MRLAPPLVFVLGCFTSSKPVTTSTPSPPTAPPPGDPPAKPADEKSVCAQRSEVLGPYTLTAEQAAGRHGANAATYADAASTLERAIEVCGIPAQRKWLQRVTCADGSAGKQLGRVGSMGSGGRCGSIIDMYKVQCPEAEYEVFLDMYMCGPGESFR